MRMRMRADEMGRRITFSTWCTASAHAFTGNETATTTAMASTPAMRPSMKVSALKTLAILRLEAPIARRIPISFLRSSTLM